MALLLDVVSTIIICVAKPYSLAKLSCIFCLRSICSIIQTWIELLRAFVCLQLRIFWSIIIWAIAILSLPIRALTALQREKMLEMRLHEMQLELDNLVWDQKTLNQQLLVATKEHRLMEAMLMELDDEYDDAICKLELLEDELQHQKVENQRLKEVQGKAVWGSRSQSEGHTEDGQNVKDSEKFQTSMLRSIKNGDGNGAKVELICKDNWKCETKNEMHEAKKSVSEVHGPIQPYIPDTVSWGIEERLALEQRRVIARFRSCFTAVLSLLVGMTVWQAPNPCLPLVVSLFTVAIMSLWSVLAFYSSMKNKPAVDVVTLLSFNWFILGTVTCPTLPIIAHLIFSALEGMVKRWFGFLA